ncbi:hypothetical protein [Roseicitreum antarcticum]|uniref:hypothetical protein n=1 Tax=Roseicitreum antarcticum TaxID=564137 RepID=UPI00115FE793|nr:hypothetical protein [Roseicitreum antarcticum]
MKHSQKTTKSEWMLTSLFVGEIFVKTKEILGLIDLLNQQLEAANKSEEIDRTFGVFLLLQSVLLHSAQLSMIFHPTWKKRRHRGHLLRTAFNMPDEIGFLQDRKMRDHIAHMDERLHAWYEESPNKVFVRRFFGERGGIAGDAITSGDIFEQYIPEERVFIFRGDEYDMIRLLSCTQKIMKKAEIINKHAWWTDDFKSYFLE